MDLTFPQKRAIKQMLEVLEERGFRNNKLKEFFSDYHFPITSDSLPPYIYYKELKELPIPVKRDILHRIFNAWKSLYDYSAMVLYQAFSLLIYLKICAGPEYFLMNAMYALIKYFGTERIWGESYSDNHYELNYGEIYQALQFSLYDIGVNKLDIKISGELLNKKHSFSTQPTQAHIQPLFNAIGSQPLKATLPWIYADGNIDCQYFNYGFDRGIIEFKLSSIKYIDNNGVS